MGMHIMTVRQDGSMSNSSYERVTDGQSVWLTQWERRLWLANLKVLTRSQWVLLVVFLALSSLVAD